MIDKTENPAEIYLVPVFDGEHDHVWCDTPAPGEGMREEDATRYVREDIYLALQAQVERLQNYIEDAQGWYNGESLKARLAETAKAAFVAGYELCQSAQPFPAMCHHNVEGFAIKYAIQQAKEQQC